MTGGGRDLGLGHEAHPMLGTRVVDPGTGHTGILRAVTRETRGTATVRWAWLSPEGGGVEWAVRLAAVEGEER